MTILEKIKSKLSNIDINELMERLKLELNIIEENKQVDQEKAQKFLEFTIYDSILFILDITHLTKVDESLYNTFIDIIKDYWYLKGYNKLIKNSTAESNENDDNDMEVSSIKEGDTQVNFSSKANSIDINGTRYSTGTINFDKNILQEKYKSALYRHRRLRWGK